VEQFIPQNFHTIEHEINPFWNSASEQTKFLHFYSSKKTPAEV
jgi:hypothetical protein